MAALLVVHEKGHAVFAPAHLADWQIVIEAARAITLAQSRVHPGTQCVTETLCAIAQVRAFAAIHTHTSSIFVKTALSLCAV